MQSPAFRLHVRQRGALSLQPRSNPQRLLPETTGSLVFVYLKGANTGRRTTNPPGSGKRAGDIPIAIGAAHTCRRTMPLREAGTWAGSTPIATGAARIGCRTAAGVHRDHATLSSRALADNASASLAILLHSTGALPPRAPPLLASGPFPSISEARTLASKQRFLRHFT